MTPSRLSPFPAWIVVVLTIVALMMVCLSPCLPHDFRLRQMKRDFARLSHPAGSRVLAARSKLGLLEGNGSHCDYFVGELRVAPLDVEALQAFYEGKATVEFSAPGASWDVSSPRESLLSIASTASRAPGETVYVVSLYDSEEPGIDYRCH